VFLPFVSEGEVIFQRDLGFIMIEVADMGLGTFIGVLLKSWLSVLALSWLVMSTGFINLVKGLEGLKVPRLFTTLLLFIYRYIFVIFDESVRLRQAMESRSFGSLWLRVKATGSILGVLFIRSYERGERVYQAMLARGYDGQLKGLKSNKFGLADTCFVSFSLVGIVFVSLVSLL
jgi:cobalt/nickel transport system permease protein